MTQIDRPKCGKKGDSGDLAKSRCEGKDEKKGKKSHLSSLSLKEKGGAVCEDGNDLEKEPKKNREGEGRNRRQEVFDGNLIDAQKSREQRGGKKGGLSRGEKKNWRSSYRCEDDEIESEISMIVLKNG